jgi:hypothetical protein
VGSLYLQRRVQQLSPSLHVFGHTHFGWDATVEGVRYVQASLCYPQERSMRRKSIEIGPAPGISVSRCSLPLPLPLPLPLHLHTVCD